ncbi:MAG: efflux RND transporter periplasmic adaptor subunit [Bdellovibrionales bacterium]|nr:efflux RND transporter periplasmic adaptor subunit [Bdellovibrionales bacterium]
MKLDSQKRKIGFALILSVGFLGILAFVKYLQISAAIAENANRGQPPEAVTSAVAQAEKWRDQLEAVGSIAPVQGAMLSAEEGGRVTAIHFTSGQKVTKGDVLVELDSEVETAQLEGAQSELELAEITLRRQRALRERNANSQSDLDAAEAAARNLRAEVARLKAVIERKRVIAPYDGRAGIRMVNIGQTLDSRSDVVEVMSIDPLFVNFSLPQQALGQLRAGLSVQIGLDAFPEKTFHAEVTAVGSAVNEMTRNIDVQATIENKEELLRPGMFAAVTVLLDREQEVVSVPTSSVRFAPYGNTVFVIKAVEGQAPRDVESRAVRLGERRGDRIAILSGVQAGEEVVSSAAFKLYPGVRVVVNNTVTPENELQPSPENA